MNEGEGSLSNGRVDCRESCGKLGPMHSAGHFGPSNRIVLANRWTVESNGQWREGEIVIVQSQILRFMSLGSEAFESSASDFLPQIQSPRPSGFPCKGTGLLTDITFRASRFFIVQSFLPSRAKGMDAVWR
jgi:hypothetical protein